jgi:hypothetical protein
MIGIFMTKSAADVEEGVGEGGERIKMTFSC